MTTPKLSRSPILQAVYADIWEYLEDLGKHEVKRYMKAFPRETDYNLVQYGNMRIYYVEIREMYAQAGAKDFLKVRKRASKNGDRGDYLISNDSLWNRYKSDVGRIAREFVNR